MGIRELKNRLSEYVRLVRAGLAREGRLRPGTGNSRELYPVLARWAPEQTL